MYVTPGCLVRGRTDEGCWMYVRPKDSEVPHPEALTSRDLGVVIAYPNGSVWILVYAHRRVAWAKVERVVVVQHARRDGRTKR